MEGSYRFYKVFSISLENTYYEKLLGKKWVLNALSMLFHGSVIGLLGSLFYFRPLPINFNEIVFHVEVPRYILFMMLLGSIALTYFMHETAHYILYKKYGGICNEMGAAFLYIFLPVVFTSVDEISTWKSKWQKISVSLAGIYMDLFLVLLLWWMSSWAVFSYHLLFILQITMIFVFIRLLTDINIFIPGTDAFFVLCDFLEKKDIHIQAYQQWKSTWQYLRNGDIRRFFNSCYQDWPKLAYTLSSGVFIMLHWLSLFALLFLPMYFTRIF